MTLTAPTTPELAVAMDLYRDIHKGIRAELFAVTLEAGRLDPADLAGRVALDAQVGDVVALLVSHAEHEDSGIQPALETHLPDLAAAIVADHEALEARMETLRDLARTARDASRSDGRRQVHQLYVELASFTSAYLAHQDVEERVVMPALERAIGPEAVLEIHGSIIAGIEPDELMRSLAVMFPAMNVDDRTELLGGMRASAPAEAYAAVVSLLRSVLDPADAAAVVDRLGAA